MIQRAAEEAPFSRQRVGPGQSRYLREPPGSPPGPAVRDGMGPTVPGGPPVCGRLQGVLGLLLVRTDVRRPSSEAPSSCANRKSPSAPVCRTAARDSTRTWGPSYYPSDRPELPPPTFVSGEGVLGPRWSDNSPVLCRRRGGGPVVGEEGVKGWGSRSSVATNSSVVSRSFDYRPQGQTRPSGAPTPPARPNWTTETRCKEFQWGEGDEVGTGGLDFGGPYCLPPVPELREEPRVL